MTAGEPGGEKKERAANLINIGNGAVQVYLSSAAKEDPKSDDTVLIGPPFYLDLKIAGFSLPIQVCLPHKPGDKLFGKAVNAVLAHLQACAPLVLQSCILSISAVDKVHQHALFSIACLCGRTLLLR